MTKRTIQRKLDSLSMFTGVEINRIMKYINGDSVAAVIHACQMVCKLEDSDIDDITIAMYN